ncbi:MAG: N-succinyl-L-ornithine transcarbamylase [Arenicella sp.]|jgi:N-succinyl-L-ornithine transcarbamylase
MKNFISIKDIEHPSELLSLAQKVKQNQFGFKQFGENKTLGLLFFNPSLRTRLSMQKAAMSLGMNVMVMNINSDGWQIELEDGTVMNQGSQEHIKEMARVVSQYCDFVGIRTFPALKSQEDDYNELILSKFLKYATVPVISLESATLHPLQSLADWLTIEEHKPKAKPKVVLTWAPHPKILPQAVANSFLEWMKFAEVDLSVTHPKGYELSEQFTKGVSIIHNQDEALENADFVYAKNWSCFQNYGTRMEGFDDWQITEEKMKLTNNGKFMHCLPIRRNVVASDSVLDSENSLIIQQANNRAFSAQAVLLKLLQNEI